MKKSTRTAKAWILNSGCRRKAQQVFHKQRFPENGKTWLSQIRISQNAFPKKYWLPYHPNPNPKKSGIGKMLV